MPNVTPEQAIHTARCVVAVLERLCPPEHRETAEPLLAEFRKIAADDYGPTSFDRCEDALLAYHNWQMDTGVSLPHHFHAHEQGWVA